MESDRRDVESLSPSVILFLLSPAPPDKEGSIQSSQNSRRDYSTPGLHCSKNLEKKLRTLSSINVDTTKLKLSLQSCRSFEGGFRTMLSAPTFLAPLSRAQEKIPEHFIVLVVFVKSLVCQN